MRYPLLILTLSLFAVSARTLFYNDPVFIAQTNYRATSVAGGGNITNLFVLDYSNRVVTAGGTIGNYSLSNAQVFLAGIQSITNKIITMSFVPTDSIIAVGTPLIYTAGAGVWTNTGYTSASLNSNGIAWANGSHWDTGVRPNTLMNTTTTNSACVAMYYYGNPGLSSGIDNGSYNSGNQDLVLYVGFGSGYIILDAFNNTSDRTQIQPSIVLGLMVGSRTTNNFAFVSSGSSSTSFTNRLLNSSVGGGGTIPTLNYWFGDVSGSPQTQLSGITNSFMWLSYGLNTNEAGLLYTNVQQLRVNLGGGYR